MRRTVYIALVALVGIIAGCATSRAPAPVASEHRIIGPKGYTVDWDLPKTDTFWIPKETADGIKVASESCNAAISVFMYHHTPTPPQYSWVGFRFEDAADHAAKV